MERGELSQDEEAYLARRSPHRHRPAARSARRGLIAVRGVGALVALGVAATAAVGVMLLNRVLSIGAAVAMALVAVVVLRGERRTACQERPLTG